MSDMEFEYETDEEAELEELRQLKAAVEDDDPGPSCCTSQFSINSKQSTCETLPDVLADIDTAIAYNKLYDQKLKIFERKLHTRLLECRMRLQEVQGAVTVEKQPSPPFIYFSCGKPYFKDRNFFNPPDNVDTILRKEAGMYDYSNMSVIGWTLRDKTNFGKLMLKHSKKLKTAEIKLKLSEIKRKERFQHKNLNSQRKKLNKELTLVNKLSLNDLALPIDQEYEWQYIADELNMRHKPQEYRALWKLYLHPSLNKKPWSKKEHDKLQSIADKTQYQGWEFIAKELDTNRSPYQCFVYFRNSMVKTCTMQKWTRQEEEYLKRLIEYYRSGNYIPWAKVASSMENRTKVQVYNKYMRLSEERKGRFLPEEDAIILTFADKHGPDFKRMKWYLPGRSLTQCRVRYNVLTKKRMSTVWTVEEDKKLIQLVANQEVPRNFWKIAKHFPDKDRVNIRARYLTLEKWMKCNPNIDIDLAPRRSSRNIKRGNKADNLNKAIYNLKQRMEFELHAKLDEAVNQQSSEEKIEDAIINLLVKEQIKIDEKKKFKPLATNDTNINEKDNLHIREGDDVNVENLKQILILLRAKLNKAKLVNSAFGKKYFQLLKDSTYTYKTAPKSYSRKVECTKPSQEELPDIWGNTMLGPRLYILPPNYANIIGCRKLMGYITDSTENNDVRYLSNCISHNNILRNEMQKLLSRFYTIFLWPMLLTNHMPPDDKPEQDTHYGREAFPPVVFTMDDYKCKEELKSNVIDEVIDLTDSDNKEKITLEEMKIF